VANGEETMLSKWTEILPLFVVRWLALRYCERFHFKTSPELLVAMPRPDVLVKVPKMLFNMTEEDFDAAHSE
jgi:hypothetical protein